MVKIRDIYAFFISKFVQELYIRVAKSSVLVSLSK
nr:unnamed protein product [Callosobruchus analis]